MAGIFEIEKARSMTGEQNLKIGGIILAAGGSSRLGEPKQFIKLAGKSLLRRAAEAITVAGCNPVTLVVGANRGETEAEVGDLAINICFNHDWPSGMSSSIRIALRELLSIDPKIDAIVIMLCDQPFIDAHTIGLLVARFKQTSKSIVAARYAGVVGVPALFSREMFDALSKLDGDKGARDLIRDPDAEIETIEIKEAAIDIDTRDDVERYDMH